MPLEDYLEIPLEGYKPPFDFITLLCDKGLADDEYPETNGWEVDYWKYFDYEGVAYIVSGSMYYGTYSIKQR